MGFWRSAVSQGGRLPMPSPHHYPPPLSPPQLHQLEAREQAERHTVAADFHEGLRLLSAQALRPTCVGRGLI